MKRYNSFHSINIFTLELATWEFEIHKHNFYELIFIANGAGQHLVNKLSYSYKKGDVFLLTPNDAHEFKIEKKTKFIYLKFTEQVFLEKLSTHKKNYWDDALKKVLLQFENVVSSIIQFKEDIQHLFSLVQIALYEFNNKAPFNNEVVLELFGAIMAIITRNLNAHSITVKHLDKDTEKINSILTFIRIYAVDNEKMNIKHLAERFFMSPNYISIFVKKHSGLSIQQHVVQSKIKLAEKLLKQKRYSIAEIADRLGFNDASHFHKIFKKYKLVNPSDF
jgi:AraC family transcriptional regulator, L-rhamnose operon regulatory protein RhaS